MENQESLSLNPPVHEKPEASPESEKTGLVLELAELSKRKRAIFLRKSLAEELAEDRKLFLADVLPAIDATIKGTPFQIEGEKTKNFHIAISDWWLNKYGFSFTWGAAREEILFLKRHNPEAFENALKEWQEKYKEYKKAVKIKKKIEGVDGRAAEILEKDLVAHPDLFFPEERLIIQKRVIEKEKLNAEEDGIFSRAVDRWWRQKTGYSYTNKAMRNIILTGAEVTAKQEVPEETIKKSKTSPKPAPKNKPVSKKPVAILDLPWSSQEIKAPQKYGEIVLEPEFFQAIAEDDGKKLTELKEKYEAEYPDWQEAIEALFGLRDILLKQKNFHRMKGKMNEKTRTKYFRDFTENQFLLTHFIIQNEKDKILAYFWEVAEKISKKTATKKEFIDWRKGLLSQVAAYKILNELGKKPTLSHPKEDMMVAIDLWVEGGSSAVQVKSWNGYDPLFLKTDEISLPAIKTEERNETTFYDSETNLANKRLAFKIKLSRYSKKIGKDIKGFMLVIPFSKIDPVTGEPSPELVEFFRDKVKD